MSSPNHPRIVHTRGLRRSRRSPGAGLALPVLAFGVLAAPGLATPPARSPAQPARSTAAAVELADEPVRLEGVGVSLRVPVGCTTQSIRIGQSPALEIVDAASTWLLKVHAPSSTNEELTLQELADTVAEQLVASARVLDADRRTESSAARVVYRDRGLTVSGREAERFYVSIPAPGETTVMRGYTVFQLSPGRFVAFDLTTTEPMFERVRPVYETIVASAALTDTPEADAARALAVQTGAGVLASLSPEHYQAVFSGAADRWERLFIPSKTGLALDDQERGYRRLRAWQGSRGELDRARPRSSWNATERQPGYLAHIQARLIQDDALIDSEASFFLSLDRAEEAFTMKMTLRQGPKPATWTLTGARSGTSMTVRTHGAGEEATTVEPFVPDTGYLAQAEAIVLGPLLVRAGIPGDFAFYTFQPEHGSVRLRRDSLDRTQGKAPGWKLTTRLSESEPAQTTWYDAAGLLIRAELPDGRVWAPTDPQTLYDLWKRKGLPTD